MSMVGFPLLLIPLAIYNMIAFLMPGVGFGETLVQVRLVSGETWTVSLGDILLALGVLLLWLEVIKAARPHGKYLTDHLLSLLVAGGAAAEFVMWPKFGNSTFFLLALLAMVDFFAGVGLRAKRRRAAAAVVAAAPAPRTEPVLAPPPKPEPETPVAEPADAADVPGSVVPAAAAPAEPGPGPAPAIEVPAAAAVAESVLMAHPDPRIATPAAAEPPPNAGVPAPEDEAGAPDQAKEHAQAAPAAPKP